MLLASILSGLGLGLGASLGTMYLVVKRDRGITPAGYLLSVGIGIAVLLGTSAIGWYLDPPHPAARCVQP